MSLDFNLALEESQRRREEIEQRHLLFQDPEVEIALEKLGKDLRERGHGTISASVVRKWGEESRYIMEPITNFYREWRALSENSLYIFN